LDSPFASDFESVVENAKVVWSGTVKMISQ